MPKPVTFFIVLSALLAALLACSFPAGDGGGGSDGGDLSGTYDVVGTNFDGSVYKGTVVITRDGAEYVVTWETGPTSYTGTGTLTDKQFTVQWTDGNNNGEVNYTLQADGSLVGTWTVDGVDGQGTETLTPRK